MKSGKERYNDTALLIAWLLLSTFLYCGVSFINWSFVPGEWNLFFRIIFVICVSAIFVVLVREQKA